MKRKLKKPVRSRLVRKWDGTNLAPDAPVVPEQADVQEVVAENEPDAPHARPIRVEDLFNDIEEEATSDA